MESDKTEKTDKTPGSPLRVIKLDSSFSTNNDLGSNPSRLGSPEFFAEDKLILNRKLSKGKYFYIKLISLNKP